MQSRKNHDKASKTAKEGDVSGTNNLTSQAKVNSSEKTKQTSSKPSKSQPSKASPRRKVQSRTDDLKHAQIIHHRHQSPSPSRGSSQASSSPISASSYSCEAHSSSAATASAAKLEDGANVAGASAAPPGAMSSPINSAPSFSRSYTPHIRKLSGRSRHSDLQGKSKVTIRHKEDGSVYIRRCSEDKSVDPDRLIVDRCSLKSFPIIEGEDQLRLLNLQHNHISQIENVHFLMNLVFLDLSDNMIEHITNLERLHFLRVLILSRNRIQIIEGLTALVHLDFLDLSGNEIKEISNINHLRELRVLNLSSNQLSNISNLKGLDSLIELNLSKNLLTVLSEVDTLPLLQRLFLAQNAFERFEDLGCLFNISSLTEISLEGCPVAMRPNYRYTVLFRLPQLKFLDMRRVLDEEKRTSQFVMKKEEAKRQETIRLAKIKETKEKAIATARQMWESACKEPKSPSSVQHDQLPVIPSPPSSVAVPLQLLASRSVQLFSEEEEDPSCSCCGGQGDNCDQCDGGRPRIVSSSSSGGSRPRQKTKKSRPRTPKKSWDSTTRSSSKKSKSIPPAELEVADARLTYLAELDDGNLQLYGPGAVAAAISNSWPPQTVSAIHTVCFHFIVFDSISHLLGKVKTQFPNVVAATFECTCLESLSQLNALGQISGLQTINISSEGNSVLQLSLWRLYTIYRLGPAIANINDITVTQLERVKAEDVFGGIGLAASSLLPKYRLSSLLNSPRVRQMFLKEKGYSPNSLQRPPDSQLASDVVKVTLTYNPDFECMQPAYKTSARKILEKNLSHTYEAMKKRLVFQRLWPSMFLEIVNDSLEDYTDLNRHMKLSMLSLVKKCKTQSDEDSCTN